MGRFFNPRVKRFLALLAEYFELVFQAQDDALHAQELLRVLDDDFVELFTKPLVMGQLEFQLVDTLGVRLLLIHLRCFCR